jgi:hypothetical protein
MLFTGMVMTLNMPEHGGADVLIGAYLSRPERKHDLRCVKHLAMASYASRITYRGFPQGLLKRVVEVVDPALVGIQLIPATEHAWLIGPWRLKTGCPRGGQKKNRDKCHLAGICSTETDSAELAALFILSPTSCPRVG